MQPPNPNTTVHVATYYSSYYPHPHPQPQNPNPVSQLQNGIHYADPALNPPGVDPYSYSQPGGVVYAHFQAVDAGSVAGQYAYYPDPSAQNWTAQQYSSNPYVTGVTIPPTGTEQLVPEISSSTVWPNPITQPHAKKTLKRAPKKTKIVQSVYCEVCKVGCNTKDVLDQHKLGKKHKKNLDKLKAALAPPPPPPQPKPQPLPPPVALAKSGNVPLIGPQENPSKAKPASGKRSKKKAAESAEELETKKRKVLEGGAAVDAVRTCSVCNVICNSETVFKHHLSGAKHIALVKKLGTGTAVATAT